MHTYHLLRADLPVLLNVPECKSAHRGGDGLCETKIRILQEREFEFVILANRYQCARRIQTL